MLAEPRLELGVLTAIASALAGATAFVGHHLSAIVLPTDGLGFEGLLLVLLTTFLGAMTVCAAVAAIGQAVNTVTGVRLPFWARASQVMLNVLLWLLYWLGLWGGLFIGSMLLFVWARSSYPAVVAGLLACAAAALSTVIVFRLLPQDIRAHLSHLNPFSRHGLLVGLVLVLVPMQVGQMVSLQCYRFIATLDRLDAPGASTLRLDVEVSGRVLNLRALEAWVVQISSAPTRPIQVPLQLVDAGHYLGWIPLAAIQPGPYRLQVLFSNYEIAGIAQRLFLRFTANNHLCRSLIFRVSN